MPGQMHQLLVLILATAITAALIPLLERRAAALHIMDLPGGRKAHDRPVARVGGIAMAVGAALPMMIWLPHDRQTGAFLLGALLILLFGVWDDRVTLSPRMKLLGQVMAVAPVVLLGGISIHSITLSGRIELPAILSLPLTFAFLVGVTNATNLADGLDGLAGGTTLLSLGAMVALAIGHDMPFMVTGGLALMGAIVGFLRFNSYPARVFMGDGGSQLLGLTAGVMAVMLTQDPRLPYSAALPLLLLGLPILDTLTVMAVRIREGRSPFVGDRRHLHHRLLARGFDQFEAVAVMYLLQGALFLLAWFMRYQSDLWILSVFGCFATGLTMAMFAAEHSGWRWRGFGERRLGEAIAAKLPVLREGRRIPRWTNVIAWACVAVYLVAVAVTSTDIGRDVAWLAAGVALVLLLSGLRLDPGPGFERLAHGAVYVAIVVAVYLDHVDTGKSQIFVAAKSVLFPAMAAAVVIRMRTTRQRRFEVTTLDVLVVFMALVLPNLPGLQGAPSNLGLSVVKLIVLLYAVEMLTGHSERVRAWLWRASSVALGLIALRGLLADLG
jgi:UDP-GlcNAc:undecaprenyl-phosphate/decaprenyl-phosphate GlcNAc-1-phosphate transferase